MSLNWLADEAKEINHSTRNSAIQSQGALTYPPGQLGIMQQITADFAGWQGRPVPSCADVIFFAASTRSMPISLDADGGAVHCITESTLDPSLRSVALLAQKVNGELAISRTARSQLTHAKDALSPNGTECAFDESLMWQSIEQGYQVAKNQPKHLMVLTTSGQQNVCSANRLYRAILDHRSFNPSTVSAHLSAITSYEIAAFLGAVIGAAQVGMPILISGFIATAVALAAVTINPTVRSWMMFTQQGESEDQRRAFSLMNAQPVIQGSSLGDENNSVVTAIEVVRSSLGLQQRVEQNFPTSAFSH